MPSFQHFQNQAEQKSQKAKFANESLSLSTILEYAESAKKQNFEAVCRLQPLVKTYRDKIGDTLQAITQAESSLGQETEIPPAYAAALTLVKESFAVHIQALEAWLKSLTQKTEPQAHKAVLEVKQSGEQLESALQGLSLKE